MRTFETGATRTVKRTIEWAAGLFEGEGCILLRGSGKRRKDGTRSQTPSLYVGMTDLEVLGSFRRVVGGGGSITGPYKAPKRKPMWHWTATWKAARGIAPRLYPYLGTRRRAKMREIFGKALYAYV